MLQVENGQTMVYVGAIYEQNVSTGVTRTYYYAGSTRIATSALAAQVQV